MMSYGPFGGDVVLVLGATLNVWLAIMHTAHSLRS